MLWWRLLQLNSSGSLARVKGANKLGDSKDARAVKHLVAALNDESSSVREAAASALGKIGDPRAVEPLTRALNDKNHQVQSAVAKALIRIGGLAVEPLITALRILPSLCDGQ